MTADERRAALVEKVAIVMFNVWNTGRNDTDPTAFRFAGEEDREGFRNEATAAVNLVRAETLEEAARVAESYEPRCDACPSGVAAAIRAMKGEA